MAEATGAPSGGATAGRSASGGWAFDFQSFEARGLSKVYGRTWALRKVDLTCRAGEVVGVSGSNGAGKSTLFRLLATLSPPSQGELLFDDVPARSVKPPAALRSRIAQLGHAASLYPDMSGVENLEFFARLHGTPAHRVAERVEWALNAVAMWPARHRQAGHCSRGMLQRLAFARVLLQDARLWLLDEPMTGLDAPTRNRLEPIVRGAAADGRIVLVVSHDAEALARLSDRQVRLERGRLLAAGTSA